MLEAKVEAESHGFENVEQYEQDKLILDNLKKQQEEDSKQPE